MGSVLGTIAVATTIIAVLAGIVAVVAEQIDDKLNVLRQRIGRTAVTPKVYGWSISELDKVRRDWISIDPKGAEYPVVHPTRISEPEQVTLELSQMK